MCEFTQREFSCGHMRWLASKHCSKYKATQNPRACEPDITAFEDRPFICGECRLKETPPQWIVFMEKWEIAIHYYR